MRHSFLGVVWLSCFVCHCWLVGVPVSNAEPQKDEHKRTVEASGEFSLRSDPLPTPLTFPGDPQAAQISTIELTGKVPDGDTGTAELTLGESTYSFNPFGDAEVVKHKPPRKLAVQLHRKSLNKYAEAFEVTTADLPLQEQLFVIRRTNPRRESELLIGNPRLDNSRQGTTISLQPRQRVDLYDQPPQATDPKYRQPLRKKVGLTSNRFRRDHTKKDQLGLIELFGDLDGRGSLFHDLNDCVYSFSRSGLSLASTAIGSGGQPVYFRHLDLADPAKQNRRIYRVEFKKPSDLGDVSLVMSPEAIGPHRLLISQSGQVNQVLRMNNSGLSLWEELQPETQKLPAPERTALAQLSDAVQENFFYRYRIQKNHVVSVDLYGDEASRESLAVLPGFPQLNYLFVSGNKVATADLAGVVQKLPSLRTFRVDDIQVGDALFKAIAELPELTSLSISNNNETSPISDEHLELLSHSRSIKTLSLTAQKVTDGGLLSLADMPQLCVLDFGARQLTDKAAQEFSNRRPKCKVRINGKSYRSNPSPMK